MKNSIFCAVYILYEIWIITVSIILNQMDWSKDSNTNSNMSKLKTKM